MAQLLPAIGAPLLATLLLASVPAAAQTPDNAGARLLLADARLALANTRTGAAENSLERAETDLLNRAGPPSSQQAKLLQAARQAREALSRHHPDRADAILQAALGAPIAPPGPQLAGMAPGTPQDAELAYPPPAPGSRYNGLQWVRPTPQATPASWIAPHWSWHGAWVWIEGHWH